MRSDYGASTFSLPWCSRQVYQHWWWKITPLRLSHSLIWDACLDWYKAFTQSVIAAGRQTLTSLAVDSRSLFEICILATNFSTCLAQSALAGSLTFKSFKTVNRDWWLRAHSAVIIDRGSYARHTTGNLECEILIG